MLARAWRLAAGIASLIVGGALLLDKLRCDLGDKVFWEGTSRYVKAGQGAAPGSGDVRSEDLLVTPRAGAI